MASRFLVHWGSKYLETIKVSGKELKLLFSLNRSFSSDDMSASNFIRCETIYIIFKAHRACPHHVPCLQQSAGFIVSNQSSVFTVKLNFSHMQMSVIIVNISTILNIPALLFLNVENEESSIFNQRIDGVLNFELWVLENFKQVAELNEVS